MTAAGLPRRYLGPAGCRAQSQASSLHGVSDYGMGNGWKGGSQFLSRAGCRLVKGPAGWR